MSNHIVFLICTEPGRLEQQSLLLAESIRKFGGKLKDTPISSFHPRKGEPISSQTIKLFDSLKVCHQQIILNIDYQDYYLANKIVTSAYAEEHIDAKFLVFLDSDKCFFAEPQEFLLPINYNIGLRPEYGKGIGSEGKNDIQDDYWQKLYKLLDIKQEIFVRTPIANKKIRGYWNSGIVVARKEAGFFTAWKNNFEKVMQQKLEPPQGNYFTEMAVLSATACSMAEALYTFSPSYSYPLPLHNRLAKEYKLNSFDEIVSIHYFNMFAYKDWNKQLAKLSNLDSVSEKYQWLIERIVKYNMPHKSVLHRHILELIRIENKLRSFNIDVNLSSLIKRITKL
ncbi:hypothetical protein GS682_23880 [Nostoc sp. B(2019)]|nr:hypothetical protein [Nostoc sp. B(2019)]